MKGDRLGELLFLSAFPRMGQHRRGAIEACHFISSFAKWDCVPTGPTSQIKHPAYAAIAEFADQPLDSVTLCIIILVSVDKIVSFSV